VDVLVFISAAVCHSASRLLAPGVEKVHVLFGKGLLLLPRSGFQEVG